MSLTLRSEYLRTTSDLMFSQTRLEKHQNHLLKLPAASSSMKRPTDARPWTRHAALAAGAKAPVLRSTRTLNKTCLEIWPGFVLNSSQVQHVTAQTLLLAENGKRRGHSMLRAQVLTSKVSAKSSTIMLSMDLALSFCHIHFCYGMFGQLWQHVRVDFRAIH